MKKNRLNYIAIACCAIFFLAAFSLGADFGKFAPDYYAAHSIAMSHLHQDGQFKTLLQTIPNSASGVFPLWLFGFFEGFLIHKVISLCVLLGVIVIIWRATHLNEYGRYFIMSMLLSPMIISATAWVLPEMFALLSVVLVCLLTVRHPKAAVILSAIVPLSRQTFIVLLAGRLFFRPKNLIAYFASMAMALLGLALLVFVWGGLVPPKLAGVHLTPSLKSPIVALLIFSLYFVYQNLKALRESPADWKRLNFSLVVAVVIVLIGLNQSPLLGGGYIFSRIEARNFLLAGIFETALLTLFFYKTKINVIVFFVLASLSFGTTNYMFLKYVDFYFFAFLAYGLSDISREFKQLFAEYAFSGFVFQIFSLVTAIVFYIL
jgi:hypothetical protein